MRFRLLEDLNDKKLSILLPILIETDPVENDSYVKSNDFIDDVESCVDKIKASIMSNLKQNMSFIKSVDKVDNIEFDFGDFKEPYITLDMSIDEEANENTILDAIKRYLKGKEELFNENYDIELNVTIVDKEIKISK